jgi:hypothetical protein
MEMSEQLHMPLLFTPMGNSPLYPLDRLGGPQNQSVSYGEEKNFAPARNQIPAIQPIARFYTVSII